MSEIPMPASEPYQPPKQSSGCGSCAKIGVIICVVFIIGIVIIAMVFWGGIASIFGGIFGGGGSTYETRVLLSDHNRDVTIHDPLETYYREEFNVYSSEVQTSTSPDVNFDISVYDTGSDSVSVTIHFAIYETDVSTVDSLSWSELNSYLIEEGDYLTQVDDFFNLNNYADTYTWVIWFDASSKGDTWSVDIDLTLRYNWNL